MLLGLVLFLLARGGTILSRTPAYSRNAVSEPVQLQGPGATNTTFPTPTPYPTPVATATPGSTPQPLATPSTTPTPVERSLRRSLRRLFPLGRCETHSFGLSDERLDKACKEVLSEVALRSQAYPKTNVLIDAFRGAQEKPTSLDVDRGENARNFLANGDLGTKVDKDRIFVRPLGISEDDVQLEFFLIPEKTAIPRGSLSAAALGPVSPGRSTPPDLDSSLPSAQNGPPLPTDVEYRETIEGRYPNRLQRDVRDLVSFSYKSALSLGTAPLPPSTETVHGQQTQLTAPPLQIPGRNLSAPLEAQMGEQYSGFIRARLTSETFDIEATNDAANEWRALDQRGQFVWEWTIQTHSTAIRQQMRIMVEVEWRLGSGTAEKLSHTLLDRPLDVEVAGFLLREEQKRRIKIGTGGFYVAGSAFIVIGVLPKRRRRREDDEPNSFPPVPAELAVERVGVPTSRAPGYSEKEWLGQREASSVAPSERGVSPGSARRTRDDSDVEIVPVRIGGEGAPAAEQDLVDCSVFSPPEVSRGSLFFVQVFVHLSEQAEAAKQRAMEFDPKTSRRLVKTLQSTLERGTELVCELRIPQLNVTAPVQTLVWRGKSESVEFPVEIPARFPLGDVLCQLAVSRGAIPLGLFFFRITVTRRPIIGKKKRTSAQLGDEVKGYRLAFISYASNNRPEAVRVAQGLQAAGVKFFQDVIDLEPGQRWAEQLYKKIDECDLFVLCWSRQAKESEWVEKEWRRALELNRAKETKEPDIKPVIVAGPPPEPPPPELAHLHFNDRLIYVVNARDRTTDNPD